MRVTLNLLFVLFGFCFSFQHLIAQEKLRDFRASNQRLALIGFFNEFVEPSAEAAILKETRQLFNKYTRTFGETSISSFKILNNPSNEYLKPSDGELLETQKEFLLRTATDNGIDILALGLIRESFDGIELELQLFDVRIQTLSEIQRRSFNLQKRTQPMEDLVYRVMNHLDREGFVNPNPQDFLQPPEFLNDLSSSNEFFFPSTDENVFISPDQLGSGPLAGTVNIGGEKTPFWEKTWFWGLVGGGIFAAAGLSYYFLVVDQPPSGADVTLEFPRLVQVAP